MERNCGQMNKNRTKGDAAQCEPANDRELS